MSGTDASRVVVLTGELLGEYGSAVQAVKQVEYPVKGVEGNLVKVTGPVRDAVMESIRGGELTVDTVWSNMSVKDRELFVKYNGRVAHDPGRLSGAALTADALAMDLVGVVVNHVMSTVTYATKFTSQSAADAVAELVRGAGSIPFGDGGEEYHDGEFLMVTSGFAEAFLGMLGGFKDLYTVREDVYGGGDGCPVPSVLSGMSDAAVMEFLVANADLHITYHNVIGQIDDGGPGVSFHWLRYELVEAAVVTMVSWLMDQSGMDRY